MMLSVVFVMRWSDNAGVCRATMTIVLDGYNAPVTAGNFVDLVNRGFYNGLVRPAATGLRRNRHVPSRVLCPVS